MAKNYFVLLDISNLITTLTYLLILFIHLVFCMPSDLLPTIELFIVMKKLFDEFFWAACPAHINFLSFISWGIDLPVSLSFYYYYFFFCSIHYYSHPNHSGYHGRFYFQIFLCKVLVSGDISYLYIRQHCIFCLSILRDDFPSLLICCWGGFFSLVSCILFHLHLLVI